MPCSPRRTLLPTRTLSTSTYGIPFLGNWQGGKKSLSRMCRPVSSMRISSPSYFYKFHRNVSMNYNEILVVSGLGVHAVLYSDRRCYMLLQQ